MIKHIKNLLSYILKPIIEDCVKQYLSENNNDRIKLSKIKVKKQKHDWIDIISISEVDEFVVEYEYMKEIFPVTHLQRFKTVQELYVGIDKIELKSNIISNPLLRVWYNNPYETSRELFVVRFAELSIDTVSSEEFKKQLVYKVRKDLDNYPELLI